MRIEKENYISYENRKFIIKSASDLTCASYNISIWKGVLSADGNLIISDGINSIYIALNGSDVKDTLYNLDHLIDFIQETRQSFIDALGEAEELAELNKEKNESN